MALTELKGRPLGTQKVVIERGPGPGVRAGADGRRPGVHRRRRARAADVPVRHAVLGLDGRGRRGRPARSRTCAARAARSCTASRSSSTTAASGRTSGDVLVGEGVDLRRVREGEERRRQARVLRDRDDVDERADRQAGRHHEVHARDQLQARRRRAEAAARDADDSPEQLSDRAEIHDVIVRYGWAIDTKDWDAARHVLHRRRGRRLLVEPGRQGRSVPRDPRLAREGDDRVPGDAAPDGRTSTSRSTATARPCRTMVTNPQGARNARRAAALLLRRRAATTTSSCAPPTAGRSPSASRPRCGSRARCPTELLLDAQTFSACRAAATTLSRNRPGASSGPTGRAAPV